jgi:HK97 family phage major capsid protein
MSAMVNVLRERRLQCWNEMKGIADKATEENRNLTPEEQGRWDGLNGELDALDKRIKSCLDQEQRAKDADAAFDKLAGAKGSGGDGTGTGTRQPESKASAEFRAFATGAPGAPRFYEVKPEGPVDLRVLSKLTAGAGGNVVPTSFYDRLMAHLIEVSALLQAGPTMLNTASGESVQVPKTTAHSTAAIVAEAGTISTSDPAFGQITLGAFKYGALFQVSRELVSDQGVDLEGYLAMQAGRALGNAFGTHMVTGTGTGQPRGVVTDATLGKTGATGVAGAFTTDDLIDLHFSVIAPYRSSQSCYWVLKDSSVATARKLKDGAGRYIFDPGQGPGVPDSILGKPILTDPNVAAVALSAKSVLFGDFSQYFVRMAGGVRFERSDEFAFNTDLVTFRALLRADAALVDLTGAIKFFAGGAT